MSKVLNKTGAALKTGAGLAGVAMLSACAVTGINDKVAAPELSPIENPVDVVGRHAVSMPQPAPDMRNYSGNSLWRTGARSFFDDQRADEIGDILTVNIEIADKAQVNNTTSRSRAGSSAANVDAFLGLDTMLNNNLPGDVSITPGVDFGSSSSSSGTGSVNRAETINLTVAAVITDKLTNGNLVIGGSQEVLVNNEVRQLLVSGVIRPQDIAADNTIAHTKIAQARIAYGGRGDLLDLQRARYGQRAVDSVLPF